MTTHMQAWIELAQSLGERDFLARHPGFFLVSTEEPGDLLTLFDTDVVDFGAPRVRRPSRRTFEVRGIEKSPENPTPDRISVGRKRSCDLYLSHSSISQLHACFRMQEGRLTITDLGSENGTQVNDKRLAPDKAEPIGTLDKVQLGSVQALVVDGCDLFDLLSRIR